MYLSDIYDDFPEPLPTNPTTLDLRPIRWDPTEANILAALDRLED
jgi:hypothetical protein